MKVPQIEGVVDHLIGSGSLKMLGADLEFEDKDDSRGYQHHVGALTHARDSKFECDPAFKRPELASNQIYLAKPGIALQRIQGEGILLGEVPQNCFGALIDKILY